MISKSNESGFDQHHHLIALEEEQSNHHHIFPIIEYPNTVNITSTASKWARVAQPIFPVNASLNIKFRLLNDAADALAITPKTGIIYIREADAFPQNIANFFKLNIAWNIAKNPTLLQEKEIQVNVLKGKRLFCTNDMNNESDNFCAKFKSESGCESSCGIGSVDGYCKWREGPKKLSRNYSTCTPDLNTCSDGKCDALELLNFHRNGNLCPQDCVKTKFVVNSIPPLVGDRGIGSTTGDHVCSCDGENRCICQVS